MQSIGITFFACNAVYNHVIFVDLQGNFFVKAIILGFLDVICYDSNVVIKTI